MIKADKIFCPRCKSEDIQPILGFLGFTGTYKCRDCDYEGLFPVKERINRKAKSIMRGKR